MSLQQILIAILVGAAAGLLADYVVKGIRLGLLGAIIVGVLGGFIGSWLFGLLGISLGSTILAQIVSSFVGAVILLFILRLFRRGRR